MKSFFDNYEFVSNIFFSSSLIANNWWAIVRINKYIY